MIPAYMALLATDIAPIIAKALKPKKLSLKTLATINPNTTDTAIFEAIITAPRPTALGVFLSEMVPPMKKRKAPTKGPAPCTTAVVKPPIFNICGKKVLITHPINMGTMMVSPGILIFFPNIFIMILLIKPQVLSITKQCLIRMFKRRIFLTIQCDTTVTVTYFS